MVSQPGQIFVGREREMAGLRPLLDDAISGHGHLVMLSGEPGIGKTRTAQELASYAESLGAQTFWGWCYEQQGAPPYWPWVQPIRSYVQRTDAELLAAQMGPGAADICEIIPEVRDKLPDLEPASPLEPEQARFRLFDSITKFLKNLAQSQPLMLVLDDLQWADQPSLLLLEFLARQLSDSRTMVVGTYRDVEVTRTHLLSNTLAQLARGDIYHREALGGLEREHVGLLIKDISGAEPTQQLVEAVYERTEGNPFFMTEIIRLLERKRHATREPEADSPGGLEIPQSVVEVIEQRLNRVSQDCQGILTTAAIIGRQFDFTLLGSLSEDTSEAQLLGSVDEGLDAYLIQEAPGEGDVYQFSHALVQQTLRERLSTSRRVRLHAKIGETLETLYGDQPGDHAAELAYHFSEASSVLGPEKLVKYATLAGDRALVSFAHEEAAIQFERGLAAKQVSPTGSEPVEDAEIAALLFGLGRARAAMVPRNELGEAFKLLSRAFGFYAQTGDVTRAVAATEVPYAPFAGLETGMAELITRSLGLVPSGSVEAGRLLALRGWVIGLEVADYSSARQALEEALAIAHRQEDSALELRTLINSANVNYFNGQTVESLKDAQDAIEIALRLEDRRAEVSARNIAVLSSDMEGARRHALAMSRVAEKIRDRYLTATAHWLNQGLANLEGDWVAARASSDRGMELSPDDPRLLYSRIITEYESGDFDTGRLYLDRMIRIAAATPAEPRLELVMTALMIPYTARITGAVHQFEVAQSAADSVSSSSAVLPALEYASRLGLALMAVQRKDEASAREQYHWLAAQGKKIAAICSDRLLGLLGRTMGDLDQAAQHFEEALVYCRDAGYRPELAWSCCDYGDALLQRNASGDYQRAATLLDDAFSISSELGMQPLTERVIAIKERAESGPVRAPVYPGGLTQREVEVIRLVAAGRTDREIAEELIVSVRTVTTHVGNILNKTGAVNRTEAASFATRHGLD